MKVVAGDALQVNSCTWISCQDGPTHSSPTSSFIENNYKPPKRPRSWIFLFIFFIFTPSTMHEDEFLKLTVFLMNVVYD
jgi:hypothetical protein